MAEHSDLPQVPDPEDTFQSVDGVPEFYVDFIHFQTQLYSGVIYLGEAPSSPSKKPRLLAKVKVSPQMLKAMALLMGKHLRNYEANIGGINLPPKLLHDWGLEEEIK